MKIKLIFNNWLDPLSRETHGVRPSTAHYFRNGTTFDGEILLDPRQEKYLKKHLNAGFVPVFIVNLPILAKLPIFLSRADGKEWDDDKLDALVKDIRENW